ncbi:sulfite exporter TauE/SafE family protein [Flavobacterium sp.]|uniref:sulfite exporter TauE/SafE family protein n=1 Tax=Flavobacterium sp. TaxID=239 RepID=UPI0026248220|nr:sulfite exporter TauE/SafE family protein [Flavobacterium sp.]MDD3005259.1 sulfite exporter TauE/SafE family protein [Flavobacterium sp.]
MEVLGYIASLFIGVTLGLIGGGGSILTVPILVYLFGINPKLATTYSLFIVGLTAAIGSVQHYKMGNIKFKTALYFALPSVIALLLTRKYILLKVPVAVIINGSYTVTRSMLIMVLFAILMLLAAYFMLKPQTQTSSSTTIKPLRLSLIGAGVGVITGFLGAGGGFLIIPTLLFFTKMNMKQAVGTSLLIIAFNSFLGFLGDLINHVEVDYFFMLSLAFIAVVGVYIGTFISKRVNGNQLKPLFGGFVLVMGIYIITKEIWF